MSAAAPAQARAFASNLARQGTESLAAALRIMSDLTAQEVALMIGMVRERASLKPAVSIAGKVVTGFTEGGKILLDLAAGESEVMADGFKEAFRLPVRIGDMVDLFPLGLGTLTEMHKRMLDAVAEQTKGFVDSYMEGRKLMAGERLVKLAQQSLESFIESQKTFLDQIAEQVAIATSSGHPAKPHQDRAKALIQMSRESIDKFMAAQKQVAELIMDQVEDVEKMRAESTPRTSVAELTRKSVQNFTSAQKSLLDLALKPLPEASTPKPRAAARRPAPKSRKRARATA